MPVVDHEQHATYWLVFSTGSGRKSPVWLGKQPGKWSGELVVRRVGIMLGLIATGQETLFVRYNKDREQFLPGN